MFEATARELEASDYTAGCVAANLSGEMASGNRPIAELASEVILGWVDAIADGVAARFPNRDASRAYAGTVMAALSGLRTMARSQRSTASFTAVAEVLVAALPPGSAQS